MEPYDERYGFIFEKNENNKKVKKGIENYIPTNNRSQLIQKGTNNIILDAYNANPSSMKEAIDNLVKTEAQKKYFILGDMLELGKEARKEHEAVVELLKWIFQT